MLDIQIRIEGEKVIISGLETLGKELQPAVMRGLQRSAISIHRQADEWLHGAGGHFQRIGKKGQQLKQPKKIMDTAAGGYPVPERTGWLRQCLAWLKPGISKTGAAGTFTAGPNEVVIYDSAIYANVIHEGRRSSAKFGPRRYLTDAFKMFNRGLGIQMAINDEIQKAKAKAGLK